MEVVTVIFQYHLNNFVALYILCTVNVAFVCCIWRAATREAEFKLLWRCVPQALKQPFWMEKAESLEDLRELDDVSAAACASRKLAVT